MTIKPLVFITIPLLSFNFISTSHAEDKLTRSPETELLNTQISDDLSFSFGLKTWVHEWETAYFQVNTSRENVPVGVDFIGETYTYTSPQEKTAIPSLSIRYKDVFFTGSYYSSTDFEFPLSSGIVWFPSDREGFIRAADVINVLDGKRKEWDFSFGYIVNSNLSFYLGYKTVRQKYINKQLLVSNEGNIVNNGNPIVAKLNQRIRGPIIGFSTVFPIRNNFSFYGTYAHGFLKNKTEESLDTPYDLLETGINYTYQPNSSIIGSISANLGYRLQNIDRTARINQKIIDLSDTTEGFTAGVSISF